MVVLVLIVQEYMWFNDTTRASAAGWKFASPPAILAQHVKAKRYVDDVLSVSTSVCGACVFKFLQGGYA